VTAVPHPAPVVEPSTERLLAQAAARIEALERRRRADHDDFDTHFAWIAGASLSPDPVPDWSEWLIDGPVGFWPLINDLLDVSGNDHHLVLSSGSYVVTGGLTGIAEFTTGLSLASGSDWTVEATINCNVDDFAIYGFGEVVVADGDEPGPGAGLTASGGSGGGPLRFGARATSGPTTAAPYEGTSVPHALAITYSGGVTKLYVDGLLVDTITGGSGATGGAFRFGGFGTAIVFPQRKSYVAIYPTALTADRIAVHALGA
jgi:hypothetical protein